MTTLPFAWVKDLIGQKRDEHREFVAFASGYAHGYQDNEAGNTVDSDDDLARRLNERFETYQEDRDG